MTARWIRLLLVPGSVLCGIVLCSIVLCSIVSCDSGNGESDPDLVINQVTANSSDGSTDVTGVYEMHLSANYWVARADHPDKILKDQQGIKTLNEFAYANDPNMVDLVNYPKERTGEDVASIILSVSKPYNKELFYRDGRKVADSDYARYTANLNLNALADIIPVQFAMVLQRADMRTWPTEDSVFKSKETFDLDRFQENGLFPADVVVVLHESEDGLWNFVQSYNYAAWVRKDKIVTGQRAEIIHYMNSTRFIVVTGSKVTTNFTPHSPEISELQLDMGVRLSLVDADKMSPNVDGQNPYASYAVHLPVRGEKDQLEFKIALIARSQDVRLGYLPYTRKTIIKQTFKFLGERYGWGHSYNARDCTGLVSEVYKTVGIYLPRNSGQQGRSPIGENIHFSPDATAEEKLKALASASAGDLLYSSGHVMMYLATENNQPYVIHDLSGSGWKDEDGKYHKGVFNGVSVTPLLSTHMSPEFTYFDKMYSIKKVR